MIVSLPWPPSILSPNARVHWGKRARAFKIYRDACWALAKAAKMEAPDTEWIQLRVTFFPPDKRHRDQDNMISSFKAGLDGFAHALNRNDSRFRADFIVDPAALGQVTIEILP